MEQLVGKSAKSKRVSERALRASCAADIPEAPDPHAWLGAHRPRLRTLVLPPHTWQNLTLQKRRRAGRALRDSETPPRRPTLSVSFWSVYKFCFSSPGVRWPLQDARVSTGARRRRSASKVSDWLGRLGAAARGGDGREAAPWGLGPSSASSSAA